MAKTLEELKAENAAAEAEAEEVVTDDTEVEVEEVEEEVEAEEPEEAEEPSEEEPEEAELEDWQQSGEQTPESGEAEFTGSDVAAAKRKLRAKLEKQHNNELEALKAEIEALKGNKTQVAETVETVPTMESCGYDEAKYQAAMSAWAISVNQNAHKSVQADQQRSQAEKQLADSVDSHYERAAKLTKETGIDETVYRDADMKVRQAIESVFPDKGEAVTDSLIARLGEGSEKVMYYLGRNAEKRAVLTDKLKSDPSGISASIYLGTLQGRITAPPKKVTQAPKPAKRAEGGNSASKSADRQMREYQKETDMQKRFDLKRAAKQAGVDVSNW